MKKEEQTTAMFRAMRELMLSADDESLVAAVEEAGIDATNLARTGRLAAERAIAVAARESDTNELSGLHEGLGVLLELLRRRDGLSREQLGLRARIGADELRRVETDRSYSPKPRTIYQLEHFFHLPKRSLVKLAGMSRDRSQRFTEEVLRFAASSKAIHKLTGEEMDLLNAFVKFLSRDAASDE